MAATQIRFDNDDAVVVEGSLAEVHDKLTAPTGPYVLLTDVRGNQIYVARDKIRRFVEMAAERPTMPRPVSGSGRRF